MPDILESLMERSLSLPTIKIKTNMNDGQEIQTEILVKPEKLKSVIKRSSSLPTIQIKSVNSGREDSSCQTEDTHYSVMKKLSNAARHLNMIKARNKIQPTNSIEMDISTNVPKHRQAASQTDSAHTNYLELFTKEMEYAMSAFNWTDFFYNLLFGLLPTTWDISTDFTLGQSQVPCGTLVKVVLLHPINRPRKCGNICSISRSLRALKLYF
jgi:hypothetical protein